MNLPINEYKSPIQLLLSLAITVLLGVSTFFVVNLHQDFKQMVDNVNTLVTQQTVLAMRFENLERNLSEQREMVKEHDRKLALYDVNLHYYLKEPINSNP